MATQDDRRFAITAPNGEANLLLMREMTVHEPISGLFRIQLSCLSDSADIAFGDMIGGAISIRMNMTAGGDSARWFHGVVARFSQGPSVGRHISYNAEVVPWLWFLTRASDCRIFQNMSVPAIIQQVFDDLGMSDYKLSLNGKYEDREYVVQYRETHYDFVCRLMEESGIGFYHEHDEKTHTLVLFDDPSSHPYVVHAKEATYATLVDGDSPPGDVTGWVVEQVLPSGKYATSDYNMRDPGMDLLADTKSHIDVGGNDRFELYDYPGEYETLDVGQNVAKRRMEAEEAASFAISGQSSRGDFMCGAKFDLKGHYRDDFDQTYLITSVVHQASQGYGTDGGGGSEYSNSFTCIPHDIPYRPPLRTPKPLISGAQTATVVGASGEEIDVDSFGRVIVKFHWDRAAARDETSSCRVRVSQAWAGKQWGAIFHPRIGQEVIVEFLEGDPDRPIITGRVYNGEQKVPFDLPAEKTQSGIQSRTTKGGGNDNFNQIRFEDKKGSEVISLQAEKNYERMVKNDETDDVQNDRTRNVGRDETVEIGNDQKSTIANERNVEVGGDERLAVGNERERQVGADESVTIGGKQEIAVEGDRSIAVGSDQQIEVAKDQGESVGGAYALEVAKDYDVTADAITLEAAKEITLVVGSAKIQLKKNGDITLNGKKITIKGSGDVVLKGSKVVQN